ncbi:hypothetical protein BD626DRAFT_501495 [Schizophyllum amplum]|uniref:F-box domain-containing protein n=1 Tax=Schizophyllum amplum TaxID=97359 RepID=A0A550C9V4_9AGAR|nr:hypothetical protein BD626DRAFT_501495 [Auriculariopsis ampla]
MQLFKDMVSFAQDYPNISDLHLHTMTVPEPGHHLRLRAALATWSHLTKVVLYVFYDPQLLCQLARCSLLAEVSVFFIHMPQQDIQYPSPVVCSSGFRSLQCLSLGGLSLGDTAAIVSSWSMRKLRAVHVSCLPAPPTMRELRCLLQCIHDHCAPITLRKVDIRGHSDLPDFSLTVDDLLPLASFTRLTQVRVEATEYAEIASWWPELEEFSVNTESINDEHDWEGEQTPATLKSLNTFTQYCPRLKVLSLPLTVTEVPALAFDARRRDHPLTRLDVGDSPICVSAEDTVRFLRNLFPNLSTVAFYGASPSEYIDDEWNGTWASVHQLIHAP